MVLHNSIDGKNKDGFIVSCVAEVLDHWQLYCEVGVDDDVTCTLCHSWHQFTAEYGFSRLECFGCYDCCIV